MASPRFVHEAQAVAQVNTETPGGAGLAIGDVFAVKLTDHLGRSDTISYTAAAATVKDVVEGLHALAVTAKANGAIPWTLVTTTEDDTALTITADTAGDPFSITATATQGGGADDQTLTDANATACNGPKLYGSAENWNTGAIPVTADTPILPAGSYDIYGGDFTSGVVLGLFTREEGHTGNIGSILKPLQLDSDTGFNLDGAGEVYLALTGATATVNITGAGSGSGDGTYGMVITTGEAAMEVNISCEPNESVGLAPYAGQTGIFTPVNVVSGTVKIGSGATVADITTSEGATVYNEDNVTSITVGRGSTVYRDGASTAGTVTVEDGGFLVERSSGAITSNAYIAGTVDASQSSKTRAWAATDCYGEYGIIDPRRTITHTGHVTYSRCSHVAHDRGENYNATYAAAS